MILELLAVGLVLSAFLAISLKDAVYSVASLAVTIIFVSILYAMNDAVFVAVFQLAIGVGVLSILFLSGEMLSERSEEKPSLKSVLLAVGAGLFLGVPCIFLSVGSPQTIFVSEISFSEALWRLRAMDSVLQGLAIMTVALGIVIVLWGREGKS